MTHHMIEYTHIGIEYEMEVVHDFETEGELLAAATNYLARTDNPSTQGFVSYVENKGLNEIYTRGRYEELTGTVLDEFKEQS